MGLCVSVVCSFLIWRNTAQYRIWMCCNSFICSWTSALFQLGAITEKLLRAFTSTSLVGRAFLYSLDTCLRLELLGCTVNAPPLLGAFQVVQEGVSKMCHFAV